MPRIFKGFNPLRFPKPAFQLRGYGVNVDCSDVTDSLYADVAPTIKLAQHVLHEYCRQPRCFLDLAAVVPIVVNQVESDCSKSCIVVLDVRPSVLIEAVIGYA